MAILDPVLEAVPRGHLSALAYVRQSRGMSQTELERAAGLPPNAVGHLESGRRQPDPARALRIAMVLDVDVRLIFPN